MKKILLGLAFLLSAHSIMADTRVGETRGMVIAAKSNCAKVPDHALLQTLSDQLGNLPYAIIPPNQPGIRLLITLACSHHSNAGTMMLYSGVVAFEALARVTKPFSEVYWVPVYDYTFYGAQVDGEMNKPLVSGIQKFIDSMTPVTRQAYQGMGVASPM
ncbi:hypothetical protein [uncultured Zhongshania sp.]|uniref:hypothetical protein n=1 Tax=uncultured Zhongshania sp. TaxID=1642288 RepID=UPI0025F69756|nr:hypothetical protein [uncultured Zhongshania sp.]